MTSAWTMILGDDLHHGLFQDASRELAPATAALNRAMVSAAQIPAGARIVDLGCGTGTQACWLAEACDAGSVVGVSTSEVGVQFARRRCEAAGLDARVRFLCADALDSGLQGESFDVAWLLESSLYLAPRERLMDECRRLLAPGGRMIIGDAVLTHPLDLRDLRRLHADLEALRRAFGDAVMGTPDEYRVAAGEAGLTVTYELDLTDAILPTFAAWRERARQESERVTSLIGASGLAEFVRACDVMEHLFVDDVIGYRILVAARPS